MKAARLVFFSSLYSFLLLFSHTGFCYPAGNRCQQLFPSFLPNCTAEESKFSPSLLSQVNKQQTNQQIEPEEKFKLPQQKSGSGAPHSLKVERSYENLEWCKLKKQSTSIYVENFFERSKTPSKLPLLCFSDTLTCLANRCTKKIRKKERKSEHRGSQT